jgi:ABC-type dipeptide/oligopeptide/nickel transport system permease component
MREFARMAARRLLLLLLTVAGAAVLSTVLVRLAPGFGMDERQLDLRLSEGSVAAIQIDAAAPNLWRCLTGLLRGDWGSSISLRRPVRELVSQRAGVTWRTLAAGLAIAWAASALLCLAGLWVRRTGLDTAMTLVTGGLLCLPAAVVAILAMYFEAGPAWALAAVLFPRVMRYARGILAAGWQRPHVLAARSRGIGPGALALRHVCLPAAPELLALAGISVSVAAGAVVPVEALCDSAGIGQLVWQAAIARDLPVLVPLTMLAAAVTCAANLCADAGRAMVCRWA